MPAHDIPLQSASDALRAKWHALVTTTIPGADLYASMPSPPSVDDRTGGRTGAGAAATAGAFFRDNALFAWADAHGETILRQHLGADPVQGGPEGNAVYGDKATLTYASCFLYPSKLVLVPVDQSLSDDLKQQQQPTTGSTALVATYTGNACTVTARYPDGHSAVIDTAQTPVTVIQAGVIRNDPLLGSYWYSEGTVSCIGSVPGCS